MWISGSALLENKEQAKSIMIGKIAAPLIHIDRKSTRLNSSHSQISYAVFCLKKKDQHRFHLIPLILALLFSSPGSDLTKRHADHDPIDLGQHRFTCGLCGLPAELTTRCIIDG